MSKQIMNDMNIYTIKHLIYTNFTLIFLRMTMCFITAILICSDKNQFSH